MTKVTMYLATPAGVQLMHFDNNPVKRTDSLTTELTPELFRAYDAAVPKRNSDDFGISS